jgi:cell division protein ZapA (FtsZ GTPase activity inhibitor)
MIMGEEYRIRGASPERVLALAGLVDRKFRDVLGPRPSMDMKRLAVLVCMNLAEELFEERSRREALGRAAAERCRRIRASVSRILAG